MLWSNTFSVIGLLKKFKVRTSSLGLYLYDLFGRLAKGLLRICKFVIYLVDRVGASL